MKTYRITLAKWSSSLVASGYPARWNSKGELVIYSAGTRALACLENIVHRGGEGLHQSFKIVEICIPDEVEVIRLDRSRLLETWRETMSYRACQQVGDDWLHGFSSAVLEVPSAIIPEESNYLINPRHPDFKRIHISSIADFLFDDRLSFERLNG